MKAAQIMPLAVGARVRVKGTPHEPGQDTGTVAVVDPGPAYGITFDTDSDDGMAGEVHRWYVGQELELEEEQRAMGDMARAQTFSATDDFSDDEYEDQLAELLADMSDDEVAEFADLAGVDTAIADTATTADTAAAADAGGSVARSRFSRLSKKLAAKGAHNPDALAAWIGRRKYGRAGMAALAAKGRLKRKAKGKAARSGPALLEDITAAELLRRLFEFDEALHPRDPKGSTTGGQFTSNPDSATKTPAKKTTGARKTPGRGGESTGSGAMFYNPATGRGTGYGMAGGDPRVRRLQEMLNRLGVTDSKGRKLKVDGKLGPLTTQAVKAAQRRMGIKVDGRVTADMLDSLGNTKSLPRKAKSSKCVCRSVECVDEHCDDEDVGEESRSGVLEMPVVEILRYERTWALDDIAVRSGGDGRTVEAYAAVFDVPSEIRDQHGHYMEVIDRKAFNRAISHGIERIGVFYHHGMTLHGTPSDLGSVPVGSPVDIRPDGKGLRTVTRYNKGQFADQVLEAIRNGDIKGYSFRGRIFQSNPMKVPRTRSGSLPTVTRTELGLSEYGPTPTPAYADAGILAVRSVEALAARFAALAPDERTELMRILSAPTPTDPEQTTPEDPETDTATPDVGPGTEDSPDEIGRSGRKAKLAEILARVGVTTTEK